MMGMEVVPKMLVSSDHFTWLMVREDFIEGQSSYH
jgi:hypothetical protein